MSRMFLIDGKPMRTWNCWVGCEFECTYCNARKMALRRLKHLPRYREGFKPHLIKTELSRRFKFGDFVMVSYMGDISFAPSSVVNSIVCIIKDQPSVSFLFCTKNPLIYSRWELLYPYPDNLYLGATIETNFDFGLTRAPVPLERYKAMVVLKHPHKFISIEPLMDFNVRTMVDWIREIGPEIVELGPDNYGNNLPEPCSSFCNEKAPWKVQWLVEMLKKICPTVVEKPGLSRLMRF